MTFHQGIWGPELEIFSIEQLNSADYLVYGRVTYEGMAAYWKAEKGEIATLMNNIPKLVFSRTLQSVEWNNSTLVKGDASSEISRMKAEGHGDMYVSGSANLSETFVNDNLFDEYRIGVAPVILGTGRPLFRKTVSPKELNLVSTQKLSSGGVILKYTSISNHRI